MAKQNDKPKRSLIRSPLLRLIFAKPLHASASQRQTEIDMLRYRDNRLGSGLGYLGMLSFILAFCLVYSNIKINNDNPVTIFGYTNAGVWVGINIFLNIITLLALFLTITNLKVYSWRWGIVAIVMGTLFVLRLFTYPLALHNAGAISSGLFAWEVALFLLAGVSLIAAGIITLILHRILANYLKTVKSIENERLAD